MAQISWGLVTSHVPSIGAAMDHGKTTDEYWSALFEGYQPARDWMAKHTPDVILVVYNDHANAVDMNLIPTFAVGTGESFSVADEGWGSRPVPQVIGHPDLATHLVESLVNDEFDIAMAQELEVDHGLTVPLSVYCPEPGAAWPAPVVPIVVNVLQYPQPTAARCYALGKAIARAVASYPHDLKVAIFGTGGMSHQLAGARAGLINQEFDLTFLDAIQNDPLSLTRLTREDYVREAGSEGLELIMWLIMRGAMNENITRITETYHVPASNTAAALAVFENEE